MGRSILLVEGKDDEHVIKHLCGMRGVGKIDNILEQGGIDKLLEAFPVRLKESNVSHLGVVVDADQDLEARWRSIQGALVGSGYLRVPDHPDPRGTILDPPTDSLLPRVGVWIMPDNQVPGILEDFLSLLIPSDQKDLAAYTKSCVDNIPPPQQKFRESARPKAYIHSWLAWQEEPGKPLGQAVTAKYLDPSRPEADSFVEWLGRFYFE